MGSDDPTQRRDEPPHVPSFFSPDDLPAWLRGDTVDSPPPTEVPRLLRARAAWATADDPSALETGIPFQAAAGATWELLATARSTGKRERRTTGTRGRFAVLALALPLIGGWLSMRW